MMARVPALLVHSVLAMAACMAQKPSSLDIRHAAGMGPYPVYVAVERIFPTDNVTAFKRFSNLLAGDISGADKLARMNGYGLELGSVLVTKRVRFALVIMGDYQFLGITGEDGNGSYLRTRQRILSARVGGRYNLFYPFTFQLAAGPLLFHQADVSLQNRKHPEQDHSIRTKGWIPHVAGIDARLRLLLFDPVGSAGGLGAFVEGQGVFFTKTFGLGPSYAKLGRGDLNRIGSFNYITWSVGITVPLALRLK